MSALASRACASSSSQVKGMLQQHSRQGPQLAPCRARCRQQQRLPVLYASGDKSPAAGTTTSSSEVDDAEARIEAIEAASRKSGGKARRQMTIKNMTPKQQESAFGRDRAEWKAGQLFPEGWEQMDPVEKATELYLGKRGMLFWASEIAWKGAIALGVAWALFRIGGAVGLYQLQALP